MSLTLTNSKLSIGNQNVITALNLKESLELGDTTITTNQFNEIELKHNEEKYAMTIDKSEVFNFVYPENNENIARDVEFVKLVVNI